MNIDDKIYLTFFIFVFIVFFTWEVATKASFYVDCKKFGHSGFYCLTHDKLV